MRRRNFLKGYQVMPTDHAVHRYAERTGVELDEAKDMIVKKFRNSRLLKFIGDNRELRREVDGRTNTKLNFIAVKKGKLFIIITCYIQGSKSDWWKNEGLKEVN